MANYTSTSNGLATPYTMNSKKLLDARCYAEKYSDLADANRTTEGLIVWVSQDSGDNLHGYYYYDGANWNYLNLSGASSKSFEVAEWDSTGAYPDVTNPSSDIIYLLPVNDSYGQLAYYEQWALTNDSTTTLQAIGTTEIRLSQYLKSQTFLDYLFSGEGKASSLSNISLELDEDTGAYYLRARGAGGSSSFDGRMTIGDDMILYFETDDDEEYDGTFSLDSNNGILYFKN